MDYYSTIKRNKVMIHTTMWMDLENVRLNEGSWTKKTTYCMTAST